MKTNVEKLRGVGAVLALALLNLTGEAQNLTGLWTGKIFTTDKTLPYEVAISEKDGKLQGYSYTTFTVKGEEMVAVKSIVVRQEKDKIIIEDEDLVFNSFDEESPKQLKQTNTLELEIVNEKTMLLMGKFRTLKTKQFRSLTGGIRLRKDSVIEQPRLLAKLEEMDLKKTLSFLQPEIEPSLAGATINEISVETPLTTTRTVTAPATVTAAATTKKPVIAPIARTAPPVRAAAPPVAANVPRKPAPIAPAPKVAAAAVKPAATPPPVAVKAPQPAVRVAPGAFQSVLSGRTIETIQTVAFKSDSITLTLYDNGEVDGDTVSVILNGKTIISKQRLTTNAVNHTIHITPELGDSLQLIMYAENLGSLPPNTGLLIIRDGRDRYEIRFAGDLTKNAAITLRKKRLDL